jgi:hypothetical protein
MAAMLRKATLPAAPFTRPLTRRDISPGFASSTAFIPCRASAAFSSSSTP